MTPRTSKPAYWSAAIGLAAWSRYQAMLDAWDSEHTEHRIPTSQGETFVIEAGRPELPAVVLLPGAMATAAMWLETIAALAGSFHVIAVDLIGDAGFSATSRPWMGTDAHARWLDDVLDQLGITAASFAGASLGGWMALDYAIRRGSRVNRLILLAPAGVGRIRPGFMMKTAPLLFLGAWGHRRALGFDMGMRSQALGLAEARFLDLFDTVRSGFIARMQPIPVFPDRSLRQLAMPVRVIVGGKDPVFDSRQTQQRIRSNVRNSEVVMLPDAGHGLANPVAWIRDCLSVACAGLLAVLCLHGAPAQAAERALPYGRNDFCAVSNQAWMAGSSIPDAMPYNSEFVESTLTLTRQVQAIVDESLRGNPQRTSQRAINHLYKSYIDLADREQRKLSSLSADLRAIGEARSPADFARLFARASREHRDLVDGSRYPAPAPFYVQDVWLDPKDTHHAVPYLAPSGLGLPDASYYLAPEPRFEQIRVRYVEHVTAILRFAGSADPGPQARHVLAVETEIARAMSANPGIPTPAGLFTVTDLTRLAPSFDWTTFFAEARLPATQVVQVDAPGYLGEVTALWAKLPAADRTLYLRWQLLRHYAPYLGSDMTREAAAFYSITLNGAQSIPPAQQLAAELLAYLLPDEISAEYVRRFASVETRAQALEVARNVRAAFRARVLAADWLQESTRAEAARKLDALTLQISHPDHQDGAAAVRLLDRDLVRNLKLLSARNYARRIGRLGKWKPQDEWLASPASINGAYSQTANTLVIPAGRLQPPLFDPAGNDASNYGGLGTLIGHELAHALDTIGSDYDAAGQLRNWWSNAERAEFQRRAALLARQFDQYEPLPGMHVSGTRTLAEDIADLSGLALGFEALQRSRQARGVAVSTAEQQRFFEGWARRWRVQYTEPLLAQIVQRDSHAPLQYRCIGPLSNFTPFYEFGGIRPGAPDYRTPEQRVRIW